ncbi:hypothetical protein BGZ73_007598, partial [Actinomortierella ambigua]
LATPASLSVTAATTAFNHSAMLKSTLILSLIVGAVSAVVCTVNDDGVNYRGGPGPEYPVLGQVNSGQKMNLRGQQGNWKMGDLWGGATGVWIHVAYLNC